MTTGPKRWVPEVGDGVVYRPYSGGPAEDGVVTGLSCEMFVFVRYADGHPGASSKATPISMLTPLFLDGDR